MEIKELNGFKLIECSRQELKNMKASDYKHGDVIHVGKYYIYIQYGPYENPNKYNTPYSCSYVELENGKKLDCFPGTSPGFTPYFIDDFKSR
jgi:hypothetical protein